jgi:hypothetical protein
MRCQHGLGHDPKTIKHDQDYLILHVFFFKHYPPLLPFSKGFHHFNLWIGDTIKLTEGCNWFCCCHNHILNFCGIFCCFSPYTFSQIFWQSCRIQHLTDTTIQRCKLTLDPTIKLWCSGSGILKIDAKLFLNASFL